MIFDIKCQSCKGIYHETTPDFNDTSRVTGNMFRLKDRWKQARWASFPERGDISGGQLECPGCGMLYVGDTGKLVAHKIGQKDEKHERYLLARKLKRDGKTIRQIAETIGVSASMAHRILNDHIGRKTLAK